MPELPEVEALRRSLLPCVQNQTILSVKIQKPKLVSSSGTVRQINQTKVEEFISRTTKRQIKNLDRRAKNLIFELSDGGIILVHLKMSGQLVYQPTKELNLKNSLVWGGHPIELSQHQLPNKHTHLIFGLENGTLFYNDIRQFGYLLYFENLTKLNESSHFNNLGLEPLSSDFTLENFQNSLKNVKGTLKKVFLEQKVVVGLGNIYTDEVCFLSGILPTKRVENLTQTEIARLYENIRAILSQAVLDGGSSVANYLLADGSKGNYAKKHFVYKRAGKDCKICGHSLKKMTLAGRTTVYCPHCQK